MSFEMDEENGLVKALVMDGNIRGVREEQLIRYGAIILTIPYLCQSFSPSPSRTDSGYEREVKTRKKFLDKNELWEIKYQQVTNS